MRSASELAKSIEVGVVCMEKGIPPLRVGRGSGRPAGWVGSGRVAGQRYFSRIFCVVISNPRNSSQAKSYQTQINSKRSSGLVEHASAGGHRRAAAALTSRTGSDNRPWTRFSCHGWLVAVARAIEMLIRIRHRATD